MARPRGNAQLLDWAGSDSDSDDLGGVRAPTAVPARTAPKSSTAVAMAGPKRGRPPGSSNKVSKPAQKAASRRGSDRIAAALDQHPDVARRALADKTNQRTTATEASKKGRKGAPVIELSLKDDAPKPKGTRGRPPRKAVAQAKETDDAPPAAPRGRRKAATPAPPVADADADDESAVDQEEVTEIPETQIVVALDDAMEVDDHEPMQDLVSPVRRVREAAPPPSASVASVRRRAGLAADADQADAVALRRRLGDATKKCDGLEARYRDLRDMGVKEAERNFDRLKKQTDERTKALNELVAGLKAELATQKDFARDGARFKLQWEAAESKAQGLQADLAEMANALSSARSETKALTTRLAAARAGDAASSSSSSSSVKGPGGGTGGAVEALQSTTAHMKEDLYGDLTGLLVRAAKREAHQDIYDCIQTGRNGTLHFKLSVRHDADHDRYDEAEFMYMPQLDANRDKGLVEVLPDYLVEEITFSRANAAKFYSRVMRSLTERQD